MLELAAELLRCPVTTSFILFCLWAYFRLFSARTEQTELAVSYNDAVHSGEIWRIACAPFLHVNLFHLALNMLSFWTLRSLERGTLGAHLSIFV